MFKKNAWIAGLLAALVIVLIGCVDALPPPEGEWTEIVKLSDIIKDAPDGVIKDDAAWAAIFGGTPFMKCGPATFTIITDGGVKKLKVDKMINSWGEGLDVRHAPTADGNGGVGYKAGDEIYIKGTADPVGIFVNAKGGQYAKVDNWSSDAVAFEKTITLTADDVTNIKVGNPQTIRLHYDDGKGDQGQRRGVIIFEEIIVSGLRMEGEGPEPPTDYSIPGNGSYNVPAATGSDIYIDLNTTIIGQLTPLDHFPDAKIEKNKLTVNFNWNTQNIFIPFDDDTKAAIQGAAKNGYTFDVVIDGTGSGHIRWCFGADRTGSWNITTLPSANFDTILTQNLATTGSPDDLNGIVLQARPSGNANSEAIATPYTITISSIKVTPKAPENAITTVSITINPPKAGTTAPTSVTGTGWSGAITWVPALPSNGKFDVSTIYSAKVVLSPSANYYLTNAAVTINTNSVSYDPVTRTTGFTNNFPVTDSTLPSLELGKVWSLEDEAWFVAGNAPTAGWWNARPLQFNSDGSKLTTAANEITVPADARTGGDYIGFDLYGGTQTGGLELDPDTYKLKVTVTGSLIGATPDGTHIQVQLNQSPYTTFINGTVDSGENVAFEFSGEIPVGFPINTGLIRIHPDKANLGFKLTGLLIENEGTR